MAQSRRGLADLGLNMTGAAMAIFDAQMRLREADCQGAEQVIHDALRSHAHWTLAVALHRAGHLGEATAARETAQALARPKGDLAAAALRD